jgi:Fe-S-cluster-containing hydrogenase component 2
VGILLITPEKCSNCRSCELVCSLTHEGEFNPARARVTVLAWESEGHSVPTMCLQCEEAGCMAICPARAISEDGSSGARLVNELTCVKCRMCIQICPFGSNSYDEKGHKILKCDLCGGEPQCAKFCPSGALVYGERSTVNVARRLQTAARLKTMVQKARR